MSEQILDVVTRLSYELNGQGLNEAAKALGQQVNQLQTLKKEAQQYNQEQSKGSKLTQAEQDAITDAIKRNQQQQKLLTEQIKQRTAENQRLVNSIKNEVGVLNQIEAKVRALKELRKTASQEAIAGYTKEIQALQAQQKALITTGKSGGFLDGLLGGSSGGGLGRQVLNGALIGLGFGGGFGLIARVVSGLIDGLQELSDKILNTITYQQQLAESAQSVASAFSTELDGIIKLNDLFAIYTDAIENNTESLKRNASAVKARGIINLEAYEAQQNQFNADQEVNKAELGDIQNAIKTTQQLKDLVKQIKGGVTTNPIYDFDPNFFARLGKGNNKVIDRAFDNAPSDIPKEIVEKLRLDLKGKNLSSTGLNLALDKTINEFEVKNRELDRAQKDQEQKISNAETEFSSKRQHAIDQLNDQLRIKIRDGNSKLTQQELSDIQTRYESAELIELTNAKKRDDALNKINDDYIKERRQLALKGQQIDELAEKRYGALRGQAQREYEDTTIRQIIAFHVKQITAEREAQQAILKADVSGLQERLRLQEKSGEDTFGTRQELSQKQLQVELNELNKRYDAQVAEQKKLGNDTTGLEEQRNEDILIITNKYQAKQIDDLYEYYQDRLTIIKRFTELELSEINGNAAEQNIRSAQAYEDDLISLRKYHEKVRRENYEATQRAKEQAVKDAQLRLQEARDYRTNVLNNPNATQADIDRANTGVSGALGSLDKATQANTNKGTYRSGFAKFITHGDVNNPALTQQEQLRLEIQRTAEAYQQLSNTAAQSFNTILDAQQRALDREISIREHRVTLALKLAERGNTEALAIEEKRLQDTQRARERAARRQQAINAALTVSNSIVAVAEAAAEGGVAAPATIAAVLAALAAGIAAAVELGASTTTDTGFEKGGYTGKGGKSEVAGKVHKGEFVMPKDITENPANRAYLEYMYKHKEPPSFSKSLMQNAYGAKLAGGTNMTDTNSKLDIIANRMDNLEFRAENKIDGHGVHQLIETQAAIERRKWK